MAVIGTTTEFEAIEQATVEPLPGSLQPQWVRCGKSWCRCVDGVQLHGPYHYRFYREAGKQHKKYVSIGQVQQVLEAIRMWKALHPPISAIELSLRSINRVYKMLTQE